MATHNSPGHIVTFRNDRLGGRLISLVNTLRIAHTYDLPFKVRWHETTDIASVFNDPAEFFQPDMIGDHFLSAPEWDKMRHALVRLGNIGGGIDTLRSLIDQGRDVLIDNSFGLAVLPGEDPDVVARETAQIWADFPLSDTLQDALPGIADRLGPNALGYHIRRGDIISVRRVMNRPWPNKYVYDEVYFAHIERTVSEGAKPVLFSDDTDTVARFTKAYPNLTAAEELLGDTPFTEGQRDALELLIMSKCRQIIAPSHSGFSSTAATLGGVEHVDVTTDLTPEEAQEAGARLVKRVANAPKTPLTGVAKGHMSQSLEHMVDVLRGEDDLLKAAKIIDRHIQAGLNISFLYPKLVELYLELGLPEKARAVGRAARKNEVHFLFDFASNEILTGLSELALGNTAALADHALNAFWNSPTVPLVSGAVGGLIQQGKLDSRNFLPFSRASVGLWNRHPLRLAMTPALCDIVGCSKEERFLVPVTDPISWDWLPLMRQIPPNGMTHHRHRPHYEKGFRRLEKDHPGPDTESLRAIYDMHVRLDDSWMSRLTALAEEFDDNAILQHRASHAAWTAKDYDRAAQWAERAVDIAPDAPAFQLWRGVTRGKAQNLAGALDDFRAVANKGFNLPRLHLRLAAAAGRCGDLKGHAKALDAAVRVAPRDAVSRLNRADFLQRSGHVDKALEDLEIVMRFDQIPPRARVLWDKCTNGASAA